MTAPSTSMRVICLEDNPLIVFHLEQMIEDLGHQFYGAVESFRNLLNLPSLKADVALVDIDLADGSTGPDAARWLAGRGIPAIFVTGQKEIAALHADAAVTTLIKPISLEDLQRSLDLIAADR